MDDNDKMNPSGRSAGFPYASGGDLYKGAADKVRDTIQSRQPTFETASGGRAGSTANDPTAPDEQPPQPDFQQVGQGTVRNGKQWFNGRWVRPFETQAGSGIGFAVDALKHGHKVTRRGWNGRDMYLELQPPDDGCSDEVASVNQRASGPRMTLPYVFMKTAQDDLVPWLCSQTDLLANDWELVKV